VPDWIRLLDELSANDALGDVLIYPRRAARELRVSGAAARVGVLRALVAAEGPATSAERELVPFSRRTSRGATKDWRTHFVRTVPYLKLRLATARCPCRSRTRSGSHALEAERLERNLGLKLQRTSWD
jgi:hypothetical protein